MQLIDRPEIFVGGDCAVNWDKSLPPTAQVAYRQGAAIASTIERSPIYQRLQNIPGFNELPAQLTELARDFSQTAYNNIAKGVDDPVTAQLGDRLLTNFRDALELELQKKNNLRDIESLLVDLLEEIKINYVDRIADGGFDKTIDEADRLRKNSVKYQT